MNLINTFVEFSQLKIMVLTQYLVIGKSPGELW